MSQELVPGESPDIDLIAASLRADATDLDAFVEGLAAKLEGAVPNQTTVNRTKRGFRGPKVVQQIVLDAGGERLVLERHGDHVHTVRAKVSGGIVLKTEQVDIEPWLGAIALALQAEAERNARTRDALEKLLM